MSDTVLPDLSGAPIYSTGSNVTYVNRFELKQFNMASVDCNTIHNLMQLNTVYRFSMYCFIAIIWPYFQSALFYCMPKSSS